MATCQTEVSAEGFDIIRLSNSRLSVSVMPQLGGKIYEIVDLKTGRDWLWKNPHIALRHPEPGLDYDRELDSGGWDEVLFSVKPCELYPATGKHFSIGDHGNVVDRAWQLTDAGANGDGEAVCELLAKGQAPHFKFSRRIVLHRAKPQFDITYSLVNTGSEAWPWLWCAHPLFAIENSMRIELQPEQEVRLLKDDASTDPDRYTWPNLNSIEYGRVDLDKIFADPANPAIFCRKLFVRSNGSACLSTTDNRECLEFNYDADELPWLGLWINKRGWSGNGAGPYLNLGMEPATSPNDFLTEAIKAGEADQLGPGQTRTWSLKVNLKHGGPA